MRYTFVCPDAGSSAGVIEVRGARLPEAVQRPATVVTVAWTDRTGPRLIDVYARA
jgi:hypothetical protein